MKPSPKKPALVRSFPKKSYSSFNEDSWFNLDMEREKEKIRQFLKVMVLFGVAFFVAVLFGQYYLGKIVTACIMTYGLYKIVMDC